MLNKIGDFYGGDYEEWRLLGYKHPVRTSHGIHSALVRVNEELFERKVAAPV
jgi:hypothetical protein